MSALISISMRSGKMCDINPINVNTANRIDISSQDESGLLNGDQLEGSMSGCD